MTPIGTPTALRGVLRRNEPLARHTSWRVGGPARYFYQPADIADLAAFLRQLPAQEPVLWLGLGSNLLVRDGGVAGTVIAVATVLNRLERDGDNVVRADAGVPCAKVARFCARHGMLGAEYLAGIPGTLGGALAMNAGAFGGETWERVVAVETLDRHGELRVRSPQDFRVGYRSVEGPPGEWFVAGHLRLAPGDPRTGSERIKELLAQRGMNQPTGQPSCGSVFRNPPGDYAARLIEQSGLKGARIGGAAVSAKHANFILNTGGASAADIEALIQQVIETVERLHAVRLQTEVRIVGEPAAAGTPTRISAEVRQ
ncbi:MAG: UDP-N-acetylmuramate dehydrogenase [Gammaproteobacteria bacterium]|nr:UDP-N-acetylmuramate dehydrogenase [Gammaproteobacteria bacterium]